MTTWIGLLLFALILCVTFNAPDWLSNTVGFLFSASFVLFLIVSAFGYVANRFAFTRRVHFADQGLQVAVPRRLRLVASDGYGRTFHRSRPRREGYYQVWLVESGLQVLALLIVPAGLGVMLVSLYVENKWITLGLFFAPIFGGIPLFLWVYKQSRLIAHKRKQYSIPDVNQVRDEDSRRPVLLLRSFREEGREAEFMIPRDVPRSLEEILVKRLQRYGPVIAIGRPGDSLPPLGASREYISDGWQARVVELVSCAQIIVAILDDSAGLMWELGQVFARGARGRLVIVLPDLESEELTRRWMALKKAIESGGSILAIDHLDAACQENLAVVFDAEGCAHRIVGRERYARYYCDAVEYAVWFIMRQSSSAQDKPQS